MTTLDRIPPVADPASKARLRLWLRLLGVSRAIENELRERLRLHHDTTLPRFDVLAAIHKSGNGLKMSDVSSVLRVSNGNVTGIVDRLVAEGQVVRLPVEGDRRATIVRLTDKGAAEFAVLAAAHESWVDELLASITVAEADRMITSAPGPARPHRSPRGAVMTAMSTLAPTHFRCRIEDRIAHVSLDRPERKNPLTFASYAALRDWFRALPYADDVDVVIFGSNGGNFSSGGDVHDIIGPLVGRDMKDLLAFTRMTGDLVKAMLACGKPVIAAVDGICVGAGAIVAMASDLRLATPEAKTAFLFTRVGLAGCDMGACAMLPRIIGQGRAAELLYTGRTMTAEEGAAWGFFNRLLPAADLDTEALDLARRIAAGPTFAHMMTKTQLNQEWSMGLEQAIEAEAQAQAICMQTQDFARAYHAFVAKQKPVFEGN